jgi:hypothetical protein
MNEKELQLMFGRLAEATEKDVPAGLGERLKSRIPAELRPHRGGMDSVSIIIDLRVSRLAAAAVIVAATVMFAAFFGKSDGSFVRDGKELVSFLSGSSRPVILSRADGELFYYGQKRGFPDSNDLLVHRRLADGTYKVIFADMRMDTLSAEELIKLQAQMLRKTR